MLLSWLFDSGDEMVRNGDNATNGEAEDQQIYKAFTDAVRVGNPLVAVSYNNGPERETESLNPFSEAVLYEDYMFGHPYNGGRKIGDHEVGLYDRNYAHIQKVTETLGNIHVGGQWDWDDKVVGHFDPPMSTTSWKGGSTPALTDDEFNLWNLESARGGGAISWGAPLKYAEGALDQLTIQDWGMAQLIGMDDHLSINQSPGAPNWARAETPLNDAEFGQAYQKIFVDGVDFWDPESDSVTLSLAGSGVPDWLTLVADSQNPGSWVLSGVPNESNATSYEFILRAEDASGASDRLVELEVGDVQSVYPYEGRATVFATADTSYGINTVATMTSEVLTGPDDLATFQLAFDVTPNAGEQIVSLKTTDATTAHSWAVSDDATFKGGDGESVQSVGNLRVINFNANGGSLAAGNIVNVGFEYATIADGHSSGDRILIDVNGVFNTAGGISLTSNPDKISLKILGYVLIDSFVLGVADDATTNKWSVNSIDLSYEILSP